MASLASARALKRGASSSTARAPKAKPRKKPATKRTEKLDLRLSARLKDTLRRAAEAAGRSLTDFVLESAMSRAEEALADRVRFNLNAEQWERFLKALDAPARTHPRMQQLLNEPGFFDQ
jgi:uncharacterized protein (DUF1778 family)